MEVSKLGYVRAWKQQTGVFRQGQRVISVGIPGLADIGGILTDINGTGIVLQLEVKTGKAVQQGNQKAFEKMITSRGGLYFVVRDIPSLLKFCDSSHRGDKKCS